MNRHVILFASMMTSSLALCASAYAEGGNYPSSGYTPVATPSADARIKTVSYSENDVYAVSAKIGYQTSIVFGDGEQITTISVGDRTPWQLIPSGNSIFIRPLVEDVATNMTVITDQHTYHFDLKSVAAESASVIYVLKFDYSPRPTFIPGMRAPVTQAKIVSPFVNPAYLPVQSASDQPISTVPGSAPVATPAPVAAPKNPNYNYTYSGPDQLAPVQVYDDGASTYVNYLAPISGIEAFTADGNGKLTPVSSYVQNNQLIVNTVTGKIVLKRDGGTVNIYNETINPR